MDYQSVEHTLARSKKGANLYKKKLRHVQKSTRFQANRIYRLKQKATESQDKVINLKHQVRQLKKTEQKSIANNKVLQRYNLLAIAMYT